MMAFRHRGTIVLLCVLAVSALLMAGCAALKFSRPIMPVKEYERMLVGSLDADYIGTNNCLAACHAHDKIRRDFTASTMGAQMSADSGMPMVDCESCHGPGSGAVKGITAEKVAEDAARGIETACNYNALIDIKNLPVPAKSLMCLRCHTANATFNLHNFATGSHAMNEVTCINCHNVHAGPDLITSPHDVSVMCFECHSQAKAEFSMRSRHPVNEGRVFCTNCHNPHDTFNEKLRREETVKETCVRCHAEKRGPYMFEHADLMEDCLNCHRSHGSPNRDLLVANETFLCMQCHEGHRTSAGAASGETKFAYYIRCSDCHSTIHGSDSPSPSGRGTFIQ